MDSEAVSAAVDFDPFSRIPEVVLTTHLLPILMEEDVKGLTSLMVVSPHFRNIAMRKLTRKDWVQKMFESTALREHFRSGEESIDEICAKLPGWKSVTDNYFDHVYLLTPNYSSFKFLEMGSTSRLFGTPNEFQLWTLSPLDLSLFKRRRNIEAWGSNQDLANFLLGTMERGGIESNPFQIRALQIQRNPEIDTERALTQLGTHVRFIYFTKEITEYESVSEEIKTVGLLLEQIPGLQVLALALYFVDEYESDEVLKFDPFPDLPNLTHLDLNLGVRVLQPFLKYSNQITTLTTKSEEFCDILNDDERYPQLFPNLERLSVVIYFPEDMMSLKKLTCPLKEIEVLCWQRTSLQKCFEAFQSISGSLVAAKIVAESKKEPFNLSGPLTANLPNLRVLSIELKPKCRSLDGLLGLPSSVGYLKIRVTRGEDNSEDESGEIIKIWEERKDLYNSNVWNLIPGLNEIWLLEDKEMDSEFGSEVVVFSRVYNRQDYVKQQGALEMDKQEICDAENKTY